MAEKFFKMKKWIKIGLMAVLAIAVIFVGISGYLGYSMTRTTRVPLSENPEAFGIAFENISFPSLDRNLILRGWLLPVKDSHSVIIIVHGNGYNRDDPSIGTLNIAAELVKNGDNVLLFDLRGYGESDGNSVGGGYLEKRDLEGAVTYSRMRGFTRIGVLGFSLGAVTALLAGAEDPEIDAIVSDSSFADLNDMMAPEFAKRTHAPSVFLNPILLMIKVMFGVDFAAIRPVEAVPEIGKKPILFIHGGADEVIPVSHACKLYAASQNSLNSLWIVPEAHHTQSYKMRPQEYINRITGFFNTALETP